MSARFASFIASQAGFVVGDGAIGTMLQSAGLPLGEPPERWNLERPAEVERVHAAYAAAGAAWATTNTFGANRVRLARFGLADRLVEINLRAVEIARRFSPGLPVMASLGPTGTASPAEWEQCYAEQVEALARTGVEVFLVETIVHLAEGTAAVRAAAGISPVVAAYTPTADGFLYDGSAPEHAAEALVRAGASVVGVNCGAGFESLLEPSRRLVAAGCAPVYAAPNAGLPTQVAPRWRYPTRTDAFAAAAIQFRDVGVRLSGGCCGSTPDHIHAAVRKLRRDADSSY
jgi:methionine synthase / methylenetetrahydrofolate reductase(NADPH)